MIKLEKGAKVRVRLHTGEVVEAVYDSPPIHPEDHPKAHWVLVNGAHYFARGNGQCYGECRFVANPCDLVPVGVSV